MKTISFQIPTMFGDHHVTEVRRILLEAPGVEDVYASSGFQVIEVAVDESKPNESWAVDKCWAAHRCLITGQAYFSLCVPRQKEIYGPAILIP